MVWGGRRAGGCLLGGRAASLCVRPAEPWELSAPHLRAGQYFPFTCHMGKLRKGCAEKFALPPPPMRLTSATRALNI